MRMPARPSPFLRVVLASFGAALLAGCTTGGSPEAPTSFGGGNAPLRVTCDVGSATVLVGSSPVEVIARVTRSNGIAAGETVSFSSTRGGIAPAQAVTDSSGTAIAFFQPPATAGTVIVSAIVADRITGDLTSSTCSVAVTAPRNPQVTVQLLSPSQAAGLNIRVRYDASRTRLASGGAVPLGPFTSTQCLAIASDDTVGLVTLNMACPQLQQSAGDIARFAFQHVSGAELGVGDFSIDCVAYDERGVAQGAACAVSVLQI